MKETLSEEQEKAALIAAGFLIETCAKGFNLDGADIQDFLTESPFIGWRKAQKGDLENYYDLADHGVEEGDPFWFTTSLGDKALAAYREFAAEKKAQRNAKA